MAEIKTLEEAKAMIGKEVRLAYNKETMSKDLAGADVLTGTVRKIISNWEHTKDGDVCTSYTYDKVDVVDPNNGGLHYVKPEKVFTLDIKDNDVKTVAIDNEMAKYQEKLVELQTQKDAIIVTIGDIEKIT